MQMEGPRICKESRAGTTRALPLLNTVQPLRRKAFNRAFAAIYLCAILTLLYHHAKSLIFSASLTHFSINLALLISDLVLAFGWIFAQAFRMCPVSRKEFPENLEKLMERGDFPALDVFICTADPYKEPPIGVVNTALSVMAYDYPTEKLSVYVSDDGGSALTLFALREGAEFASHWLAFCRKNNLVDRSPEAYFESEHPRTTETQKIKEMYENMKLKVDRVLERGNVDEFVTEEQERKVFKTWTSDKFTRQNHPTVIQVLLDAKEDKDVAGHSMPNFIYVSREKSKGTPHHFKAGALNVLLRVSAVMTNAPMMLTLDCDMFSNDPKTPLRAICYLCDPALRSKVAYVQFPQRFHGINRNDTYAGECKRLFQIHPIGGDGLRGPIHVGTGAFFNRRSFFGSPTSNVAPEIPELDPHHVVDSNIQSQSTLALAHQVASCNYENQTNWGIKLGYRYGSLVEDYYTGYRLQCEGWRSIFCDPLGRFAFLGDAPISLFDALSQQKRWCIGLLEAGICKYSPLTFGFKALGPLAAVSYAQHAFWALWSIPITTYAFLPQFALLNHVYIFPKASEPLFFLYFFLLLGAYAQDLFEFVMSNSGGTFRAWWNDQRFWLIRGLSCYFYGLMEFSLKALGIPGFGFNVTSKVIDDELKKRYDQGMFEFGVHTPMFVPITMAAIINLVSFAKVLALVFEGTDLLESVFVQLFLAGFAVVNSWPIYEAMFLRSDKGKLPLKTTAVSVILSSVLYAASSSILSSS